jgi:hypothetical protein
MLASLLRSFGEPIILLPVYKFSLAILGHPWRGV